MKKLFYLLIFLLVGQTSSATHNMASNISFTHISGYTYNITINTFTSIGPSVVADRCELEIYFSDGDSASIPRINGPDILGCDTHHDGILISACTGVLKHNIYEGSYTFPGSGNYTITMIDPNRNTSICNIINSGNTPLTLQAELIINPIFGYNNSPVYNAMPVNCYAIDTISYYNPAVTEADGDSLFYELINPMGVPIPDYTIPTTSISFTMNNSTGTVTWNVPTTICFYVYDLQIKEYRHIGGGYYYIGSTMEEVWNVVENSIIPSGILESNYDKTALHIFPNPSGGDAITFNIENPAINVDYNIVIYNSIGQMLKIVNTKNNISFKMNENELADGIYFYSLRTNNNVLNKGKFIISGSSLK